MITYRRWQPHSGGWEWTVWSLCCLWLSKYLYFCNQFAHTRIDCRAIFRGPSSPVVYSAMSAGKAFPPFVSPSCDLFLIEICEFLCLLSPFNLFFSPSEKLFNN